jgi:CheY-like chemotaxis protein
MKRVLLLEDDLFSALALASLLEGEGFVVHSVPSAERALEISAAEPPDLLIADWNIEGGETSAGVARRLRLLNPQVRIVFVTGYDKQDIAAAIVDLRPYELFSKPLDFDNFIAEVKEQASVRPYGQATLALVPEKGGEIA